MQVRNKSEKMSKNVGGKYCIPCCFETESFFRAKQNKSRQECGCPDIKPVSEKNPHHKNFECDGKEKAFQAPPLRRVRQPSASLDLLKQQQPLEESEEGEQARVEQSQTKPQVNLSLQALRQRELAKKAFKKMDVDVGVDVESPTTVLVATAFTLAIVRD